jgi:hypothetical protein
MQCDDASDHWKERQLALFRGSHVVLLELKQMVAPWLA